MDIWLIQIDLKFFVALINNDMRMYKIMDKKVLKRALYFFVLAMIVTILATVITYIVNPDIKGVMDSFENMSSDELRESTKIQKVQEYIVNNGFRVPLQMFILALIPIQFLYLVNIISTAVLPGILFGLVFHLDFIKGIEIIVSASPHYVIEIFGFCLFASVLFELNRGIRSKFRSVFKKDENPSFLFNKLLRTIIIYLALILPMIIIAAFLETYIADFILNLFS